MDMGKDRLFKEITDIMKRTSEFCEKMDVWGEIRGFIGKGFVSQIELEKFRKEVLSRMKMDEKTFLRFHRCESLEEYLLKQKFCAIESIGKKTLPQRMIWLISEVMLKLPYDVVHKLAYELLDEIIYVDSSMVMVREKPSSGSRFKILLYKPDFDGKVSKERKYFIIAHELAHVYLEHDIRKEEDYLFQFEDEANKLAESWGFRKPRGWQKGYTC